MLVPKTSWMSLSVNKTECQLLKIPETFSAKYMGFGVLKSSF